MDIKQKAKEVYANEPPRPQPVENPEFLQYDTTRQVYMDYITIKKDYK